MLRILTVVLLVVVSTVQSAGYYYPLDRLGNKEVRGSDWGSEYLDKYRDQAKNMMSEMNFMTGWSNFIKTW